MLADLHPGRSPAVQRTHFLGAAGTFGLVAIGDQLWSTDGTATGWRLIREGYGGLGAAIGTRMVLPISIGSYTGLHVSDGSSLTFVSRLGGTAGVGQLVTLGSVAVFDCHEPVAGSELWVTDGTSVGTRLLVDLRPGSTGSAPQQLVRSGPLIYFLADDGVIGQEVWRTDGTAAGTFPIADLVPGRAGIAGLWQILPTPGGVVFPFHDKLYATRGSRGDLTSLVDLPTAASGFALAGNRVVFTVGCSLWSTDGRSVQRVQDFRRLLSLQRPDRRPEYAVELNGRVLFPASDGQSGLELWSTDGTPAGTAMVADIAPGTEDSSPYPLFRVGGIAYLVADTAGIGRELWRTDGTATGTRFVADMTPGADSSTILAVTELSGRYLVLVGLGTQPTSVWSVDSIGAQSILAIPRNGCGTHPLQMLRADDQLALSIHGVSDVELRRFAANGSVELLGIANAVAARDTELGFVRGQDFLVAEGGSAPRLVSTFASNLRPVSVRSALGLYFLGVWDNRSAHELWRSDGTAAGTFGLGITEPREIVALEDRVLLVGPELQPDSIAAHDGRQVLATITLPGARPKMAQRTGYRAVFSAFGNQLWSSDGTRAGTQPLHTLSGEIQALASDGQVAYAIDDAGLIVSDGTPWGTARVRNLQIPRIHELAVVGGKAFFVRDDPASGPELWVSDGTAAGTDVLDVVPGAEGLEPRRLTVVGDRVAFSGRHPSHGREPWASDGTRAGTRLVADVRPGVAGSAPERFVPAGSSVFFLADDGVHGVEPWVAPIAGFGAALSEPMGGGCPGSLGLTALLADPPRLGDASHALVVGFANPTSAGALLLSDRSTSVRLGACTLRVATVVALPFVTSAGGGARLPLPVPAHPSLLGATVVAQVAITDPRGAWRGVASLSNGLRMAVGR